jgi:hypothetical protein
MTKKIQYKKKIKEIFLKVLDTLYKPTRHSQHDLSGSQELTCLIDFQKSRYGNSYYINIIIDADDYIVPQGLWPHLFEFRLSLIEAFRNIETYMTNIDIDLDKKLSLLESIIKSNKCYFENFLKKEKIKEYIQNEIHPFSIAGKSVREYFN